jgi:plastocyanin
MKNFIVLLVLLTFGSLNSWGQIIPTEIMYNPPESGTDSLEYLELYNAGNTTINLEGYIFSAGVNYTFGSLEIPAQSYIVICGNDTAFQNTFGFEAAAQWEDGALNNGGESLTLLNASGVEVFSLNFDDNPPWPETADGDGPSLELCDLTADFTLPGSWGAANTPTGVLIDGTEIFGTPGNMNDSDCGLNFDVRVEVSSNVFTPADITIDIGQTVLWENTGGSHNVNGTQNTFPNNPSSFSSGAPSSSNWTYTYTFNQTGLYNYQCDPHAGLGMVGTVTVIDPNAADDYPVRSIAEMTTSDANGIVDSIDQACTLVGTIHGQNRRPNGYEFALIDSNGDGIVVFSSNEINGYSANEGDELEVKGVIGQFNGSGQINADSIRLLSTANNLLEPRVVRTLDENTESEYITLESVRFTDVSQWEGDGGSFNLDLEVIETGEIVTCRIDGDFELADLSAPPQGANGETFQIVGIGGQFDNNEPFTSGYQIFPSTELDFIELSHSTQFEDFNVEIYPNPVQEILHIQDLPAEMKEIRVLDITGKTILLLKNSGTQIQLSLSNLQAGNYFIVGSIKGTRYVYQFLKQ